MQVQNPLKDNVDCFLPLLILCLVLDKIPGVSMMLRLSKTWFGKCTHWNLQENNIFIYINWKHNRFPLSSFEYIIISNEIIVSFPTVSHFSVRLTCQI